MADFQLEAEFPANYSPSNLGNAVRIAFIQDIIDHAKDPRGRGSMRLFLLAEQSFVSCDQVFPGDTLHHRVGLDHFLLD